MKNSFMKGLLGLGLGLGLGLAVAAFAAAPAKAVEPIDLNTYLVENTVGTENPNTGAVTYALAVDRTRVNDHHIEGYLSYTLDTGRTIKMYIGRHSALRAYINVIALPNGVEDTYAFLEEQGWIEMADSQGELIFVLEPADGVWGTPAEEADYLEATLAENISNTAFGLRSTYAGGIVTRGSFDVEVGRISVFTGHSANYYIGYGEGCAVLESWTSQNPKLVAAQAFVGGESVGEEILAKNGSTTYWGINNGGYYPGQDKMTFEMELLKLYREGVISSKDPITNADVIVPTLFAGYAEDDPSVGYWKAANDVVEEAVDGVYHQALDSDGWQTDYTNVIAAEMGSEYGVSEVVVKAETDLDAAAIHGFVAQYTRYTTPFVYSNALGMRTDYYPVTQAARTAAESGEAIQTVAYGSVEGDEKEVEIRALETAPLSAPLIGATGGNVYHCITAFNDYNEDGVLDPREAILYVPAKAKEYGENGAPVVIVFPGSTQASCTFFDCTYWWHEADVQGCVIAVLGQFCSRSAASLGYGSNDDSSNFSRSTLAILDQVVAEKEGIKLDLSRVYGSGHSAGCSLVQKLTHNSESGYYAAVGGTSFPNSDFDYRNGMPSFIAIGQADISEPLPDTRSRDLVKEPWLTTADSAVYNWIKGCLTDNGVEWTFDDNGNKEAFLATCLDYNEVGRYHTYSFADADNADIAVVKFQRTMVREHNSMPIEVRFAYDFMKYFSLKDGKRWYSPSAFETAGDEVQVIQCHEDIQ